MNLSLKNSRYNTCMSSPSAPKFLLGALVLFCVGVWSLLLAPQGTVLTSAPEQSVEKVAAVLESVPPQQTLDPQTKTTGCQVEGPLPDHACTPGAVFVSATPEVICVSGYTKQVRNVSTATKKRMFAAYAISYPQPTGSYEVDHLIPLELGGSNETANLFPEAAQPAPGFKEKDVVEDYLHDEVCAGRLGLREAQLQISTDWVAVYNALSPETISEIKGRFRSWAD